MGSACECRPSQRCPGSLEGSRHSESVVLAVEPGREGHRRVHRHAVPVDGVGHRDGRMSRHVREVEIRRMRRRTQVDVHVLEQRIELMQGPLSNTIGLEVFDRRDEARRA